MRTSDSQPQVAFPLGREPPNRGAVKRQVVPALDKKLLIVVEHVQTAFQIAEQHGDGLDSLFVGQVLEPVLLNLLQGTATFAEPLSLSN